MSLILDAYGRPVLHPGDVIAIRQGGQLGDVREPLRITRIRWTGDDEHQPAGGTYRIYFKEAMSSNEEWVFSHDIEVKLLARADRDASI